MKNLFFLFFLLFLLNNCVSDDKNVSANNDLQIETEIKNNNFKENEKNILQQQNTSVNEIQNGNDTSINNVIDNIDNNGDDNSNFKSEENNSKQDCIYDIKNVEITKTLNKYQGLATYDKGYSQYNKEALFELPYSLSDKIKLYDGLNIDEIEGQCFVINDTYEYEKYGETKVIPIITLAKDDKKKNEEQEEEKFIKLLLPYISEYACSSVDKKELIKQGYKNEEQCKCYLNAIFGDNNLSKNKSETDILLNGLLKAEEKCGKLLNTKNYNNKTKQTKKNSKKK